MNYKNIFIVTYGRSGSTLLMGILNSIPHVKIKGENYNLIYKYFHLVQSLRYLSCLNSIDIKESTHPWFSSKGSLLDKLHHLIISSINNYIYDEVPSGFVTGFKEIRYFDNFEDDDFNLYFEFLNKNFNNSCFILNTRNHNEVVRSGCWQRENPIELIEKLSKFETSIRNIFINCTNFFEIDFYDVINQSQNLSNMFKFLGADYSHQKICELLKVKHSN